MTRRGLAIVLAMSAATPAPAASFTYSDGICEYRIAYSPAKVDGARLKATFGFLTDSGTAIEAGPSFASAEDVAAIDLEAFRGRCAAHRRKLEHLSFIDLPGIEDARRAELGVLDESCRLSEASLAAAKGDAGPMRTFAPACVRYADLLDLPAKELKARFNDLVVDLCRSSTEVGVCAGQLQRDGEGPGSEARRRHAVIARWGECATSKRLAAASRADAPNDREKIRLKDLLARRFRSKTLSCAQ